MVKNIQFTKISFKTAAVSFISNLLVKQKGKKKLHTVTFSELLYHLQIPFSVCSWSICVWINTSTVWQPYPRKNLIQKDIAKFRFDHSIFSFSFFVLFCLAISIWIYNFKNICKKYIYIPFHVINLFDNVKYSAALLLWKRALTVIRTMHTTYNKLLEACLLPWPWKYQVQFLIYFLCPRNKNLS